jgi:hypothetical protein
VHTEIPYAGLVHEGLSRHKQKTKELNQPLICERSVRRDEFHDHYQYHIYAECTTFLGRCPLKWKGCDFTVQEALRPAQGRFRLPLYFWKINSIISEI